MNEIDLTLNITQHKFVEDNSPVVGFFGGLGNGKTFAGCLKAIQRVVDPAQDPQLGCIARQTYPELRDSTMRSFFDLLHKFNMLPGVHYKYYKQENRVVFKNGHEILFRSLDDPAKLLSVNLGWFYIDQAEETSEEMYLTLLGRLRSVEKPNAWITGNPLGHNWVWHRFVHRPVKGNVMYVAKTDENAHNLPSGYIESLRDNYNEIWVNRYIHGSWDAFEGQIYPDWDERQHLVADMVPPVEWPRYISIDHGRTNPTAVLWSAMDWDGNMWFYREHYEAGQNIEYHVKIIKGHKGEGSTESYIIDASTGAGKQGDPETIGNRYRTMGIPVIGSFRDVQGGIDKVTQLLKNNKIKVCRSLVNFRKEIVNYQWEQPSASRMDLNQPEKPLKKDDHCMDSCRYNVVFAFENVKPKKVMTNTEKFIHSIVNDDMFPVGTPEQSGDWDNI